MEKKEFDYIVIGGGTAGLSSALYAARGGLRAVVLEGPEPGGQALQINGLENYPGIFPPVSGYDFIAGLKRQCAEFGAEFSRGMALSIDRPGNEFTVTSDSGIYSAPAVLVATGASHRKLGVPGEAEFTGRGVSYCAVCDGPFFRNRRIVVAGGGDSAVSEALYLSSLSDDVTVVHRRGEFRAQKSLVARMEAAGIRTVTGARITEIMGKEGRVDAVVLKDSVSGKESVLGTDAVFVFIGMEPRTSLVDNLAKDPAGYILAGEDMSTSVPGLFAAGDVRSKALRQVVTAASDGAAAAFSAMEYVRKFRTGEPR